MFPDWLSKRDDALTSSGALVQLCHRQVTASHVTSLETSPPDVIGVNRASALVQPKPMPSVTIAEAGPILVRLWAHETSINDGATKIVMAAWEPVAQKGRPRGLDRVGSLPACGSFVMDDEDRASDDERTLLVPPVSPSTGPSGRPRRTLHAPPRTMSDGASNAVTEKKRGRPPARASVVEVRQGSSTTPALLRKDRGNPTSVAESPAPAASTKRVEDGRPVVTEPVRPALGNASADVAGLSASPAGDVPQAVDKLRAAGLAMVLGGKKQSFATVSRRIIKKTTLIQEIRRRNSTANDGSEALAARLGTQGGSSVSSGVPGKRILDRLRILLQEDGPASRRRWPVALRLLWWAIVLLAALNAVLAVVQAVVLSGVFNTFASDSEFRGWPLPPCNPTPFPFARCRSCNRPCRTVNDVFPVPNRRVDTLLHARFHGIHQSPSRTSP